MFPGPESSKRVVVRCKGCGENIPAAMRRAASHFKLPSYSQTPTEWLKDRSNCLEIRGTNGLSSGRVGVQDLVSSLRASKRLRAGWKKPKKFFRKTEKQCCLNAAAPSLLTSARGTSRNHPRLGIGTQSALKGPAGAFGCP
jgi:hypothetical protein